MKKTDKKDRVIKINKEEIYENVKRGAVMVVTAKSVDYALNTLKYGMAQSFGIAVLAGTVTGVAVDLGAYGAKTAINKTKELKVKKTEKKEKEAKNIKKVEDLIEEIDAALEV